MKLEVEGIEFEGFTTASATVSMVDFSGSFSFTAVTKGGQALPIKGNESCRVTVDGVPVITGFIERVDVDYSSDSHTITYSGRDQTSDVGDSSIETINDIKAPVSLEDIIVRVIASLPGSNIKLDSDAGDIELFSKAEDIISPAKGENAFDFLEKWARKRQVLLTTDGLGNILISKTSTEKYEIGLQNVLNDPDSNNILSASAVYDFSNIYRKYIVESQLNNSAVNLAGIFSASSIVDQAAFYEDTDAREGRQLVISAEQSSGKTDAAKRAEWESNIHKSRSRVYRARVAGYRNGSELWAPNKLIGVNDEFAGINDTMLVESVTYNSSSEGSIVDLILVQKDSFILASQEPVKVKGGNLGDDFVKSLTQSN